MSKCHKRFLIWHMLEWPEFVSLSCIASLSLCGYTGLLAKNLYCNRACYGVLRFIMESGAKGCEVSLKDFCAFCFVWLLWMLFWLWLNIMVRPQFSLLMQVIVSGKLRAQRAKSMKFKDGYMISSGQPVNEYIDSAVRHVLLRQVSSS